VSNQPAVFRRPGTFWDAHARRPPRRGRLSDTPHDPRLRANLLRHAGLNARDLDDKTPAPSSTRQRRSLVAACSCRILC
jgi:hypothetical protein